jgi:RNase P protein component
VRNRIRRQLRAIVADLGPSLAPGRYLIGAAPLAATLPYAALADAVRRGLEDAGALAGAHS